MAEKEWEQQRELQWPAALKAFLQAHFPGATVTLKPKHQTAFIDSIDGAHGAASLAISPEALTTLVRSSRPVNPDVFSKIDKEHDLFAKPSPMITGKWQCFYLTKRLRVRPASNSQPRCMIVAPRLVMRYSS